MRESRRGWFEILTSTLLCGIGTLVLAGWWLHIPILVQPLPGSVAMVPNSAFGFVLAGAGLLSGGSLIRRGCGVALAVLAGGVFAQDLFGVDLRLDQLLVRTWVHDANPNPGRMAPQTALCFIAAGLALILLDTKRSPRAAAAVQVLALLVGATGIVSLIGYSLKLELLYSWYQYTRMALHTAVCFSLLGLAMWLQCYRRSAAVGAFEEHEDRRVNVIGSALIVLVAAVGGSSGFILLAAQTEKISREALTQSLASQLDLVKAALAERRSDVAAVAGAVLSQPGGLSELTPADLQGFIRDQVVGIHMQSADGKRIIAAGALHDDAAFSMGIDEATTLLWSEGATVRVERIVSDGPRLLGRLTVEMRLPVIEHLIADSAVLSATGDLRICGVLSATQMRCLPTRLVPRPVLLAERSRDGTPLAMSHALEGVRGTTVFRNYRDVQAIGAFAPLANTRLGFVLQQDTADLYAPLRHPLQLLFLVLALLIVFSITMLRLQIAPLVRQAMDARAAAAAGEMRMAAIMGSVPDGIVTIDSRGTIVAVNPALNEMFGYAESDLIGQPMRMLMPPEMQAAHDKGMQRYMGGGAPHLVGQGAVEVPARRRDGTIFTAQLTLTEMRLGDARYVVGNMRDITLPKFAEAQLRKVNERLKLATQAAAIGVWEWDLASNVLIWDTRMHELLAIPVSTTPLYELWRRRVHPADIERVERAINSTLAGEHDSNCEFRMLLPDGSERTLRSAAIVARDEEGKPLRMTGVNWDITETKRLERMKSEFVSVVSHELRTPLTSIRGSLGLVVGNAAGALPGKAQQLLDIAYRNTDRLTELINDILDIEKIESGGLIFESQPLAVRTLIEQAIEHNQGYAAAREVQLHFEPSSDEAAVIGDSSRLLQVMANLLSNATKFSPPGSRVEIRMTSMTHLVRVSVRDHGPGIPENFKARVFQKFSQADSSDTRAKGGTGLGLAISKAIIERLGGRIGYDSTVGAGTTFYFELPLQDAPRQDGRPDEGLGERRSVTA